MRTIGVLAVVLLLAIWIWSRRRTGQEGKQGAEPGTAAQAPAANLPGVAHEAQVPVAVIAAAVAAALAQEEAATGGFVVRAIRRVGSGVPAWNRAGREEQVYSRF